MITFEQFTTPTQITVYPKEGLLELDAMELTLEDLGYDHPVWLDLDLGEQEQKISTYLMDTYGILDFEFAAE